MHDLANGVGLEIALDKAEASIMATWWMRPGLALLPSAPTLGVQCRSVYVALRFTKCP